MKVILFLTIIVFSSCENKKEAIVNRQRSIRKEMEQLKVIYYKKSDSLESVKQAATHSTKLLEISQELISADKKKLATLCKFQLEYDSLERALKKY